MTLPAALEATAGGPGELVFHLKDGPLRLPFERLLTAARRGAAGLRARGVGPGDAVGILGPNDPGWARAAFSVWCAGGVVVPLPYHLRIGDRRAFAQTIAGLARAAGTRLVLTHPDFLRFAPEGLAVPWDEPDAPPSGAGAEPGADDPAVIQFTSGSTAFPKGVVLTHGAVLAGIRASAAGGGLVGEDCVQLSWLPFFHDWGLFGYLLWSVVIGVRTHVMPTERFARDPAGWLRLAGAVAATMTPAPTSAWAAALRAAARRPDGIDLSSLRLCNLAAEAIDPTVVDRLLDEGARLGLRPDALSGAYGMAETTLAISVCPVGEGLPVDHVDREALGEGRAEPADAGVRRVPSCGVPVPGTEVRVVGPDGVPVPDRRVGELQVRGPGLMTGYLGDAGEEAFVDGWLRTGDLGYRADGHVFLTGRRKDLIIVMGRNYAPQDIEWAAERAAGVRRGRCVAFSREGTDGELIVVVEPAGAPDAVDVGAVWKTIGDAVGIAPREVLVVPRGTVRLTTSGKLRRSWIRGAYEAGRIQAAAIARGPASAPPLVRGAAG